MADIELIVKIDANVYTRLFDNGIQDNEIATDDICEMARALRLGKPLPKGHGRLIDADAFIAMMEDVSKRQKYKELLIDDYLTVDDVFKAIIESLLNKGLAEGDSPTIIEADKAESEDGE